MAPPQVIPILGQMEDTSIQVSHLWSPGGCVSSQRPRLDFNNGPGNNSSSGCILYPRRLFESDSNNGSTSVQVEVLLFSSGVPSMVSWWVQYLVKGPRPDFNNGPQKTRIVATLLPPGVYSSLTRIMAPTQTIPILVRWQILLFSCPLMVSW